MQRLNWIPALFTLLATPAAAAERLDAGDWRALEETAQYSLEYAQTNQAATWVNPDTGTAGSFRPLATHHGPQGEVCREYTIIGTIGGREEQIYGTACRQSDGSWLEVSPEPTQAAPLPDTTDSRYVPYESGSYVREQRWVIPNIAISGSYCGGGFCVGGGYGYASRFYPFGIGFHYGNYHGRHRHHSSHGYQQSWPKGWSYHRDDRHPKPSHHGKYRSHGWGRHYGGHGKSKQSHAMRAAHGGRH